MTNPPAFPMTLQDWLPWVFLLLLGIAGGFINTYRRWRKDRVISLFELVGELTTSGFVAVLIAVSCRALEISPLWTLVLAGIGAHLGSRALFIMEWLGLRRIGLQQEEVETLIERPTGFPRFRKHPSDEPTWKPPSDMGP